MIGGQDGRGRLVAVMALSVGDATRPVQMLQFAWHVAP